MHFILAVSNSRLQGCLCIKVQGKPLSDIAKGHLVSGMVAAVFAIGVAQDHMYLVAHMVNIDTDYTRFDGWFYAVVDGIFQERLQHKRGH